MKTLMIAVCVVCSAGCGGKGGGGTAPGPIVTAPTITTSNTMIHVGQTVQFTATGSGTIRWGGDNPAVATIDPITGQATGVGLGRVTIWAENEGGRTTRLLRGLPLFTGLWRGFYVVQSCQATGAHATAGFCSTSFRVGDRHNVSFIFFQTEDRVGGATFSLGPMLGFTFSTPGRLTESTVGEDGQIRLSGTGEPIHNSSLRYTLENIRLESPAPGVMEGEFEQRWSDTAAPGIARVFVRLDNMTREIFFPTLSRR
jgi:hypothetical protein